MPLSPFKAFQDIIGQEKAIGFLKTVIQSGKMPHAYLFTGIPGVGKTTTALALAQAVNCEQPVNHQGCRACRTCRQIEHGNFPDLTAVEPEGQNIKIEQIREINRNLNYKPISGKYRVSIIQQAETLTLEAANSFLKTLEEPPPDNILILNVIEPRDLLPTIVSRCQRIGFRPLPTPVISAYLTKEHGINGEKADLLAKIAEGSLGRAQMLIENDFIQKRQEFIEGVVRLQSRGVRAEQMLEMAEDYSIIDRRGGSSINRQTSYLSQLLGVWKSWYRDLILLKVHGPRELLINIDFSNKLREISRNLKLERLIDSLLVIDQAHRDYVQFRNRDLIVENMMLDLKDLAGK